MSITSSHHCALQVAQQGVTLLLQWIDSDLSKRYQRDITSEALAVCRAKELLNWHSAKEIKSLQLLFDKVRLQPDGQRQKQPHYYAMRAIANTDPQIPYPLKDEPNDAEQNAFKQEIKDEILKALQNSENWENLSLLMLLLEKYGSCLSFGESDVALIDQVRVTGAIASALATDVAATHLSLVAGDLSGIQKFIYTISSDGALKSLRARSFYLELVTEEVVQQLLEKLQLPRTSIIYAGGGNLYLIAPGEKIDTLVLEVRERLNQWLKDEFQGKVFLALSCHQFETEKLADQQFAEEWDKAIRKVNQQKTQKFLEQIKQSDSLLVPRHSYTTVCRVCHRDDTEDLEELNGSDSVLACLTCRTMFQLGGKLLKANVIVRSLQSNLTGKPLQFNFPSTASTPVEVIYYHFFDNWKQVLQSPDAVFLINDWTIEHYQFKHFQNASPLLLGNYGKETEKPEETGFMTAAEFADLAKGIKRVGYLRMDVDRLGQIFAKGLGVNYSLPRLASLSRQISYFFKVYLNSLASDRQTNFLNQSEQLKFKALTESDRQDLLFIYAGGDDLFISGAWDEIIEFAFDVYQSFCAYTGNNPDITLSGGISLEDAKFPLYQAAEESGAAEDAAKNNGRDSLGLFGSAFKWSEWLGADQTGEASDQIIEQIQEKEQASNYWNKQELPAQPSLLGILPFVSRIQPKLQSDFSRSFIRNLLITAELQEQRVRDIQEQRKHEEYKHQLQDIQYYLHLPQIAYTLARLPSRIKNDISFEPIRTSLKSPYNAPYFRAIATWIELLTRN
jgi:CRISPR-associated protein Csm1